jgi:hypothetical protein
VNADVGDVRLAYRDPNQGYTQGWDRYQHDTRENSYVCQYLAGTGPRKNATENRIDGQLVADAWKGRHGVKDWATIDGKVVCQPRWPEK